MDSGVGAKLFSRLLNPLSMVQIMRVYSPEVDWQMSYSSVRWYLRLYSREMSCKSIWNNLAFFGSAEFAVFCCDWISLIIRKPCSLISDYLTTADTDADDSGLINVLISHCSAEFLCEVDLNTAGDTS